MAVHVHIHDARRPTVRQGRDASGYVTHAEQAYTLASTASNHHEHSSAANAHNVAAEKAWSARTTGDGKDPHQVAYQAHKAAERSHDKARLGTVSHDDARRASGWALKATRDAHKA